MVLFPGMFTPENCLVHLSLHFVFYLFVLLLTKTPILFSKWLDFTLKSTLDQIRKTLSLQNCMHIFMYFSLSEFIKGSTHIFIRFSKEFMTPPKKDG